MIDVFDLVLVVDKSEPQDLVTSIEAQLLVARNKLRR